MAGEALPVVVDDAINIASNVMLATSVGVASLQAASFRSQALVNASNRFSTDHISEVRQFADQTVSYAHENNIGAIGLVDGAARTFYIPLISRWRELYDAHDDRRPPIFFINPQGFQTRKSLGFHAIIGPILKPIVKGGPIGMPWQHRSRQSVIEGFASEMPGLYSLRDKPLLLIDGCIHSGSSIAPVLSILDEVGFNDVRLEVASRKRILHKKSSCKPDLVLSDKMPKGGCYPFGTDKIVDKTHKSSISQQTKSRRRREMAIKLRNNLHRYFNDQKADN